MDNNDKIRLSGIAYESLVNGPGIRRVLFSQGCSHNCKECFNPETHPFTGGELLNIDEIIKAIKDNPILTGVTFSGGDPLDQADKFAYIAKNINECGLNIWMYTGYTFEYIIENKDNRKGWNDLLKYVDVIVDGEFECDNTNHLLKFRGSANQRIINVKESIKKLQIITLNYDKK